MREHSCRTGFTLVEMWWLDGSDWRINGPGPQAFSSRHPGGANFGFCDGSVRFIPEGVNVDTVRWLAGRQDGEVLAGNF